MIDHLKHMAIFARVVDEGSFRAAARAIGVAPSRVSETITALETQLGVSLLHRTTRRIGLTNEGRILYARVVEMMRAAEAGMNDLNASTLEPTGALSVSMPAFLSSSRLSQSVGAFVRLHPKVSLSVSYTDHRQNILEGGFDVLIRAGWLEDSAMMARKLDTMERHLVSGAGYAAARPVPQHARDLKDWDWIRYRQHQNRAALVEFTSPEGDAVKVDHRSRIEVDSADALYQFACQDLGATTLPSFLAEQGVAAGRLVRLLPEWSLRPLGIYAVWPNTSRRDTLTTKFVRFLAEKQKRAATMETGTEGQSPES